MAGNFKVDPASVRDAASHLANQVAPGYANSATNLANGGKIDAPGFGVALFWVQAAYQQGLDFIIKDLQGAQDFTADIASRLNQTADEYDKAENLNISGFHGKGAHEQSYLSAAGSALVSTVPAGAATAGVELAIVLACAGSLDTCAGLCPTFIPAAITAATFICNVPSIFHAGTALSNESNHVKEVLNSAFAQLCGEASKDWTGEGATNFTLLTNKVKSQLDDLGGYIGTVGTALEAIAVALTTLWLGLIALAGPFLIWLIAMRLAEASPPWLQDAALEPIIEAMGTVLGTTVLTTLAGISSAVAAAAAVISAAIGKMTGLLSPPDTGQKGVPDMQEFSVNTNFSTAL